MMTLEDTPTQFVEAAGTRFSYRWLGPRVGIPLICLQHFSGTMDAWDPAVVNALAKDRSVIVFNNVGLGQSSGTTPDNVAQMAADAARFIAALHFSKVDLLGYSLGNMVAQVLAAEHPKLVHKLLLVGTAPQGGEEHLMEVLKEAQSHKEAPDSARPILWLCEVSGMVVPADRKTLKPHRLVFWQGTWGQWHGRRWCRLARILNCNNEQRREKWRRTCPPIAQSMW
jgi:pimeloyl-ACP methyl ester carboxylesterase